MRTAPFASLLLVADPVTPTDPVAPNFVGEVAAEEASYLFGSWVLTIEEAAGLFPELMVWRRMSGFDSLIDADSEFKSTGESNGAMEDSKRKLDRSGALYHWIEIAREYLLDDINVSPDRIEETDVQYDWLSTKPTPSQGG